MVETVVEDGYTVVIHVSLNKRHCKNKQSNQTTKELNEEKIFSGFPSFLGMVGVGVGVGGGKVRIYV